MSNFIIQSQKGNAVVLANPADIDNKLARNLAITTVKTTGNKKHDRVRANSTVSAKIGVTTECTDCKELLPQSCRVEISTPVLKSTEDRNKFLKLVFEPAVADMRARLEANVASGFNGPVETQTGTI